MTVHLDEILAHSFTDFHAKGLDYLCLLRSPEITVKAYFFEGDVASAPEVVVPHDHRYCFNTRVLGRCYTSHSSRYGWYKGGAS